MGDIERREPSGRRARGKAKQPYQVEVNERTGKVRYGKQVTNPLTKKRDWIRADTPLELLAMVAEVNRVRRNQRAGLIAFQDLGKAVADATKRGSSLAEAWDKYRLSPGITEGWKKKLGVAVPKKGELPQGMWFNNIGPQLGKRTLPELTGEVMAKWVTWLSKRVAPATVENVYNCLRSCVRQAIDRGELREFPWGSWKLHLVVEDRKKSIGESRDALETSAELDEFIRAAKVVAEREALRGWLPDLHRRVAVMALIAWRGSEGVAFSWDHLRVEPDGRIALHVRHAAKEGWRKRYGAEGRPVDKPKAGSVGAVYLAPDGLVAHFLREQRAELERLGWYRPDGPVFPDFQGRYRSRALVKSDVVREVARLSNLDHAGLRWVQHSLRHSGVRLGLAAGMAPRDVQKLVRHASLTTTDGYIGTSGRSRVTNAADALAGASFGDAAPLASLPELGDASTNTVSEWGRDAELVADTRDAARVPDEVQRARVARAHHEKHLGREVAPLSEFIDLESDALPGPVRAMCATKYRRGYTKTYNQGRGEAEGTAEFYQRCKQAGVNAKRGLIARYYYLREEALEKRRGEEAARVLREEGARVRAEEEALREARAEEELAEAAAKPRARTVRGGAPKGAR